MHFKPNEELVNKVRLICEREYGRDLDDLEVKEVISNLMDFYQCASEIMQQNRDIHAVGDQSRSEAS